MIVHIQKYQNQSLITPSRHPRVTGRTVVVVAAVAAQPHVSAHESSIQDSEQ